MLWARGTPALLVTLWKPLAPLRRGFSLRSSSPRHPLTPHRGLASYSSASHRRASYRYLEIRFQPPRRRLRQALLQSPAPSCGPIRWLLPLSGSYARKFRTIRGFPSESNVVTLIFHPAGILSTAPLLPVLRSVWPLWSQGSTGIGHPGTETGSVAFRGRPPSPPCHAYVLVYVLVPKHNVAQPSRRSAGALTALPRRLQGWASKGSSRSRLALPFRESAGLVEVQEPSRAEKREAEEEWRQRLKSAGGILPEPSSGLIQCL